MLEISEELVAFLESQSAFTEIMGTALFPIAVVEGQGFPFTTYRIIEKAPLSKDGKSASMQLSFYFGPNEYKRAASFTDVVQTIIESKENYEWETKTVDFLDDAFSFVGIINFKIN
jgi:hypothetical protein